MPHSSDVTATIVKTVAAYEKADPYELPPVEDKLDSLTYQELTDAHLTEPLKFEYLWYDVTVLPDGEVIVTP